MESTNMGKGPKFIMVILGIILAVLIGGLIGYMVGKGMKPETMGIEPSKTYSLMRVKVS